MKESHKKLKETLRVNYGTPEKNGRYKNQVHLYYTMKHSRR